MIKCYYMRSSLVTTSHNKQKNCTSRLNLNHQISQDINNAFPEKFNWYSHFINQLNLVLWGFLFLGGCKLGLHMLLHFGTHSQWTHLTKIWQKLNQLKFFTALISKWKHTFKNILKNQLYFWFLQHHISTTELHFGIENKWKYSFI